MTNLRHHHVLHESVLLLSVDISAVLRIPVARRATVHELGEGFTQVVLHFGSSEEPDVESVLSQIVVKGFGFEPAIATCFVGRETVLATDTPGMVLWREHVFAFMHINAASAARYFGVPAHHVVEVGVQVEI